MVTATSDVYPPPTLKASEEERLGLQSNPRQCHTGRDICRFPKTLLPLARRVAHQSQARGGQARRFHPGNGQAVPLRSGHRRALAANGAQGDGQPWRATRQRDVGRADRAQRGTRADARETAAQPPGQASSEAAGSRCRHPGEGRDPRDPRAHHRPRPGAIDHRDIHRAARQRVARAALGRCRPRPRRVDGPAAGRRERSHRAAQIARRQAHRAADADGRQRVTRMEAGLPEDPGGSRLPQPVRTPQALRTITRDTLAPVQRAAGLSTGRNPKYGMHAFRHFAASLFIEQGSRPAGPSADRAFLGGRGEKSGCSSAHFAAKV